MKTSIPCKITYSQEDNCWYVESPGFYSGIMTYGDTLDYAKEMAVESVSGLLESYLEHGDDFVIPEMPTQNVASDWYAIPIEVGLSFALWLRKERKLHNMTLSDVAEKLGVKYQVVQNLENPRKTNPTLKTLKKIEDVFDVELVSM